jgi:hypothetical protein
MIDKLADALTDFSEFNQCERLTIEKSNNKSLVKELLKRVDG